jgi:hypothetical protein
MLQSRSWITDEKLVVDSTHQWGATEEAKAYFFAPRIVSFCSPGDSKFDDGLGWNWIFGCVFGFRSATRLALLIR